MSDDFSATLAGDVGFSRIGGWAGFAVEQGQSVCGDGSVWSHVVLAIGGDYLIEARPSGARIRKIDPAEDILWYRLNLTAFQRTYLSVWPREDLLAGTIRYSWASYVYISLLRFGLKPDWLKQKIAKGRSVQCAQMVDRYITNAGYHLLDGFDHGSVTPGDLSFRFANDRNIVPFRLDGKPTWSRPK